MNDSLITHRQLSQLLRSYHSYSLKCSGNSMQPLLKPGDMLFLRKVPFHTIKENDILAIKKDAKLLIHRVIYKKQKYVITKGDNNTYNDGKTYERNIYAKVQFVTRNGKKITPELVYDKQSKQYYFEILKFKRELERRHIRHVFLKGLPLHMFYEQKFPRRIYEDCDILIGDESFELAKKILVRMGYSKIDNSFFPLHTKLLGKEVECAYGKVVKNVLVVFDLHRKVVFLVVHLSKLDRLFPDRIVDEMTERFLSSRVKKIVHGEQFFFLSPEIYIVYLLLHIFHHNFTGAFRYLFLQRVWKKESTRLKIRKMIDVINQYSVNSFIYPALYLMKKYYLADNTSTLAEAIKPVGYRLVYTKSVLFKQNIFDEGKRIKAGIIRFLNVLILSPTNIFQKMRSFIHIQLVLIAVWLIYKRLKSMSFRFLSILNA